MRVKRRPYYLLRPRLWREPLGMIDIRTMVSRRARYLYVRVPKAANSTVVGALLGHCPEPGVDATDIEGAKSGVTHLSDLGMLDLPALRRYFVFTVVRNPYVRTLSAHLDKFQDGATHADRFGARIAEHGGGAVSFRGFCRYLAAGGEAENAHWMRQTRLTGVADRLDFVGRVETIEADLHLILAGVGAPDPASIARAGPAPTGAAARLREHSDDEARFIVETVYRRDFEAFGYRIGDIEPAPGTDPVRAPAGPGSRPR